MGSMDLPAWVAELTDPRRATTVDELADRLTPLAEQAIDVSRRMQALLNELNEPFKSETLHEMIDRLKTRTTEALKEVSDEIIASGSERVERIRAAWQEAEGEGSGGGAEGQGDVLDLETDIVPAVSEQERQIVGRITGEASEALREATGVLLGRVDELAAVITDLIHDVLPSAQEGLRLASRLSGLAGRARAVRGGPIPDDLGAEAEEAVRAFDETMAGLELEWAALGARSAIARSALRGAEESAFSQVTTAVTASVARLATGYVQSLDEIEARARELGGVA